MQSKNQKTTPTDFLENTDFLKFFSYDENIEIKLIFEKSKLSLY